MFRVVAAAVVMCLVSGPVNPAAAASPKRETAGPYAQGEKTYKKLCAACHKPNGSGGLKLMAKGRESANFREAVFWTTHSDSLIRTRIMNGEPKSGMPAFKEVLSVDAVEAVMLFIRQQFAPKEYKRAPGASRPDSGSTHTGDS